MVKENLDLICPKGDIPQEGLDDPNKGILCGVDQLKLEAEGKVVRNQLNWHQDIVREFQVQGPQ